MNKLTSLNRQFISNFKTTESITKAKRDLILSILKSTTTKREARNYLEKYQNQFDFSDIAFGKEENTPLLSRRDNQRELFVNRFLSKKNPFVNIYEDEDTKLSKIPLRIALFKITLSDISNETWEGISETLKRLVNLGISPVVVLDHGELNTANFKADTFYGMSQANKLMNCLGKTTEGEDGAIESTFLRSLFMSKNGKLSITSLEQILIPLYQGIIPIVQPITYNSTDLFQTLLNANRALFSLCSRLLDTTDLLSVEKIVIIDPIGGIPSIERNQTSHVFINLSQEFSDIVSELYIGFLHPRVRDQHLKNLRAMDEILDLAARKSKSNETTGIITTPLIMSVNDDQLNPIVYNVLTDRPIISSSLPSSQKRTPQISTSIVKKGFPVTVLDEHSFHGEFTFQNLVNANFINRDRLFDLMNDSFRRELNAPEYVERIDKSIASIIIVGDYDGAAIITWEFSPTGEKIAYLDKFAISKKNQGLPSLADIIFKLILQSHQSELIWRSRKNNPVNKWYFERCCGSLGLPLSPWKLFYAGEMFDNRMSKVNEEGHLTGIDITQKLNTYVDVVERIPPSFLQ